MKKKTSLILDDEFLQYCELNKISDIDKLAKEIFSKGFSIIKYGETPKIARGKEKVVEKEVIKEIEVEKIIEVIKEVPVEKIVEVIKEVPVEKIVEVQKEVTNTKELEKLMKENQDLKTELEKITSSLQKLNKGRFLKNSDLNTLYDE